MSTKSVLSPTLAALLGAASLSVSAPSVAMSAETERTHTVASAATAPAAPVELEGSSLRDLIDERLERAAANGRHDEIEQLGTLWMTLAQRDQLDRVVDRGEGFLNVALRNQRYSELRAEARARRVALVDRAILEDLSSAKNEHVDERLDVERFVSKLDAPYRDAVQLSLEGLNHREIAERMGVSHAAARKWAQRLRERVSWPD